MTFSLLISATGARALEHENYYVIQHVELTWFQNAFVNRVCPTHGGFKADDGMEFGASFTERASGFWGYEMRLYGLIQGLAWLKTYGVTFKGDMTLSDADEKKVCLKFRAQRTTRWRTLPDVAQ